MFLLISLSLLDLKQCNSTWMTAIPNVPEQATNGPWTKVSITNLKPGTDYEFRILSINSRGSVTSEPFQRRTAEMAIITELPQKGSRSEFYSMQKKRILLYIIDVHLIKKKKSFWFKF